jgi:hypothetical protein
MSAIEPANKAMEPAKDRMGRKLRDAIAHLRSDIDRVEFWADAIDGMGAPIPEYDHTGDNLNQFRLAEQVDANGRRARKSVRDT